MPTNGASPPGCSAGTVLLISAPMIGPGWIQSPADLQVSLPPHGDTNLLTVFPPSLKSIFMRKRKTGRRARQTRR